MINGELGNVSNLISSSPLNGIKNSFGMMPSNVMAC